MAGRSVLDEVRGAVSRVLVRNALMFDRVRDPADSPLNVPAKMAAAHRIEREERIRSQREAPNGNPHNDVYDARRHAEASRRLAVEAGPLSSTIGGAGHELVNLRDAWRGEAVPGLSGAAGVKAILPESSMDMHNNLVGVRAAVTGMPLDERRLQTRPGIAPSSYRQ